MCAPPAGGAVISVAFWAICHPANNALRLFPWLSGLPWLPGRIFSNCSCRAVASLTRVGVATAAFLVAAGAFLEIALPALHATQAFGSETFPAMGTHVGPTLGTIRNPRRRFIAARRTYAGDSGVPVSFGAAADTGGFAVLRHLQLRIQSTWRDLRNSVGAFIVLARDGDHFRSHSCAGPSCANPDNRATKKPIEDNHRARTLDQYRQRPQISSPSGQCRSIFRAMIFRSGTLFSKTTPPLIPTSIE